MNKLRQIRINPDDEYIDGVPIIPNHPELRGKSAQHEASGDSQEHPTPPSEEASADKQD